MSTFVDFCMILFSFVKFCNFLVLSIFSALSLEENTNMEMPAQNASFLWFFLLLFHVFVCSVYFFLMIVYEGYKVCLRVNILWYEYNLHNFEKYQNTITRVHRTEKVTKNRSCWGFKIFLACHGNIFNITNITLKICILRIISNPYYIQNPSSKKCSTYSINPCHCLSLYSVLSTLMPSVSK